MSASPAAPAPLWPRPIPVIGLTGEYASGKTLFALTVCPGPQTLVYDTEKSSEPYRDLGFHRVDTAEEMLKRHPRGYTPLDTFVWWRQHVRSLPAGKYRVILLDTIGEIESGLADYVHTNPEEFGHTRATYQRMSGIMWGDVREHWKLLLSDLASRCETFVFTAHLRQVWAGNQPTMRRKPQGKSTLEELASLYLWLERRPDAKGNVPAVPSATVRKQRLIHTHIDPKTGEVLIAPALPPRIPVATPAAVRQYQLSPPDYAKLRPEERAPEEKASEEDMAELRARTAEVEAETERLRLERMERQQKGAGQGRGAAKTPAPPGPALTAPQKFPQPPAQSRPATNGGANGAPDAGPMRLAGDEQLDSIRLLRNRLFELAPPNDPTLAWQTILARRGVNTARHLTREQADELIARLQKNLDTAEHERLEEATLGPPLT